MPKKPVRRRKPPRYPPPQDTRAAILAAEEEVIRMLRRWGFTSAGHTDVRVEHTVGGKEVRLGNRKRFVRWNGMRATVGSVTTFIYWPNGEAPIPIAKLDTRRVDEVRTALRNLKDTGVFNERRMSK